MGYRPDFQNPFAALGRGLAQVAERAGQFFADRAQKQYTEGVNAIARAQAQLDDIAELERSPDFTATPEEQAAINAIRAQATQVVNAEPTQARELWANASQNLGVDVKTIAGRAARPAGGNANRQQGGATAARAGTPDRTVTTPTDTESFITSLYRRTGRAQIARTEQREEEVMRLDAELQTAIQRAGIDAQTAGQIKVEDLQRAHDLMMLGKETEAQQLLMALDNSYQLQQGSMQALYDDMLANNAFERALTLDEQVRQETRLTDALTAFTNDPGNPVARGILGSIARDTRLPQWMQTAASDALNVDTGVAGAAWVARQEQILAEAKAGADIAPLEVERAQQMVDLGKQELVIGGQRIALGQLELTGESMRQAQEIFENNMFKITSANEYVDNAIALGMPEHIYALVQAKDDPTHPLYAIAQQLTDGQIQQAGEMAQDAHNIVGRQNKLLDAQISEALSAIGTDAIVRTHQLVSSIASTYEPSEIMGLATSDQRIKTLMDAGLLTESDLKAAVAQANFRKSLEQDQINGQRVEMAMSQLDTYGNPENFLTPGDGYEESWNTATAGLRAVLNDLVGMGYMQADQVDGLVSSFQAGWQNGANSYEMDKALNDAQIAAYRAQAALNNANATGGGGDGDVPMDEAQIRALTAMHSANLDRIREGNPNCFDPESGVPMGGDECAAAKAEYDLAGSNFDDFISSVMGYLPSAGDIASMPQDRLLGYAASIAGKSDRNGNPIAWTPGETAVWSAIAETVGGEEELWRLLGVEVPDPNAPDFDIPEEGAPGLGRGASTTPPVGQQAMPEDATGPLTWGMTPAQISTILERGLGAVPDRVRNEVFNRARAAGVDTTSAAAVLQWFREQADAAGTTGGR